MQSLLWDARIGIIRPMEFSTSVVELFYSGLRQRIGKNVFPVNCHSNAAVNSLSLDSNDRYLLSGCADSSIKLWDTSVSVKVLQKDDGFIDNGEDKYDDFDPDIVNNNYNNDDDDDENDYDNPITTISNLATIPRKAAHEFGVSSIKWWPYDSGMFVSASFDHSVKVWDTNELEVVYAFDVSNRVYSIDICGQQTNNYDANALVAVASDQPFVRLLDLRSSASAHSINAHKGKTLSVKWHPSNGNILATGGYDGEAKIWDIRRSQSCLCRLDMLKTGEVGDFSDNLKKVSVKAHLGPVNGLEWGDLGHILYTAGNDDKIRVWEMSTSFAPPINKLVNFGPLTRNKYPQTLSFILSPSEETEFQHLIFPSDNGDVLVYRSLDGKLISRLVRKGNKNTGRTSSMVYMKRFLGTYLCGTMDGEIITWDYHK